MTRGEQRHELVAELAIGHRRAGLVPRLEQEREDVLPGPVGAARGDLAEDQLVGARDLALEDVVRREAEELAAERGHHRERAEGRHLPIEDGHQRVAERARPRLVLHAEHGSKDDLEGDPLHEGVNLDLHATPGRAKRALGDVDHRLAVRGHPIAVERRHQETPLPEVLRAVEQEHAPRSQQRLERRVGLAGSEDLGVGGEDLLHDLRMREARLLAEDQGVDLERVAVLALAELEELDRAGGVERGLKRGVKGEPGRQHRIRMGAADEQVKARGTPMRTNKVSLETRSTKPNLGPPD